MTFTRTATGELRERVRDRLVVRRATVWRGRWPASPPPADDEVLRLPRRRPRRRGRTATPAAGGRAGRLRRGHDRHHPRVLPAHAERARHRRRRRGRRHLRRGSDRPRRARWSTTSTCGKFWRPAATRRSTGPRRCASERSRSPTPTLRSSRPTPSRTSDAADAPASGRGGAAGGRRPQAAHEASSPTTTCSPGWRRRCRTRPAGPRPAPGCASATGVALVDEFQDTDPIQWEIMRRAFGRTAARRSCSSAIRNRRSTRFRGADVYAYLAAARHGGDTGDARRELAQRPGAHRRLRRAAAAAHGSATRASSTARCGPPTPTDGPGSAAPRTRRRCGCGSSTATTGSCSSRRRAGRARRRRGSTSPRTSPPTSSRLLSSAAEMVDRDRDGSESGGRAGAARPRRRARRARTARRHWSARRSTRRVPAVINGAGSVFGTPIAREWLALLEALERPSSPTRVRAAALTLFLGWPAERVATADDDEWEHVYLAHPPLGATCSAAGASPRCSRRSTHAEALPGRLLARPDGERDAHRPPPHRPAPPRRGDVRAARRHRPDGVARPADRRGGRRHERRGPQPPPRVRLRSGAGAHHLPRARASSSPSSTARTSGTRAGSPRSEPPVFHDPAAGDRRTIDVGGADDPGFDDHWQQYLAEERGEELRLAYVALDPGPPPGGGVVGELVGQPASRPLARLLFPPDDGEPRPSSCATPAERGRRRRPADGDRGHGAGLDQRRAHHGRRRPAVGRGRRPRGRARRPAVRPAARRRVAADLVHRPHGRPSTSPTAPASRRTTGITDEQMPTAGEPRPTRREASSPTRTRCAPCRCRWRRCRAGRRIGSLVHSRARARRLHRRRPRRRAAPAVSTTRWPGADVDVGPTDDGRRRAAAAIETPLGPLVGDRAAARHRAGRPARRARASSCRWSAATRPVAELTVDAVAGLLDDHLAPGDPLAGYADRLRDPALAQHAAGLPHRQPRRGAAVAGRRRHAAVRRRRLQDELARRRRRGADRLALPAGGARRRRCSGPTTRSRRCSTRSRSTATCAGGCRLRPRRNLAGVLYLFLRGMTGADVPRVGRQPCGVFAWRPPAGLVVALSDLFDRGAAGDVTDASTAPVGPDRADVAAGPAGAGLLRDVQHRRACSSPPTCTSPSGSARSAARPTTSCCSAAALAVRAPRLAHVCIDLAAVRDTGDERARRARRPAGACRGPTSTDWVAALSASPLVAVGDDGPADRPLRLDGTRLYLDRYWREERRIAADLLDRSGQPAADVDAAVLAAGSGPAVPRRPTPDLQRPRRRPRS